MLIRLGRTPEEAINLIREKRSERALNNKYFVESLMNKKNNFIQVITRQLNVSALKKIVGTYCFQRHS